jgi:hypothetical protein
MELIRADPRLRWLAIAIVIVFAAAGSIALWAMQRWLDGMREPSPASMAQLLAAFVCLMGTTVLMLAALGAFLWQYGKRVRAASLFPPPGAKVVRDTPVLRGAAALRRGLVLQGLGVLFVLCCIGLALATWRFHALFSVHAA